MKHPTKLKSKLNKHRSFFRKMLDPSDHESSSKRFITLIMALHFIIGSSLYLFLFPLLLFMNVKNDLEIIKVVSTTIDKILEYDFWIITVGLGFITAEQAIRVMVEKAKAIIGLNNTGILDPTTSDTTPPNLKKDETGELIG